MKEEVSDDNSKLPIDNGRVVLWLEPVEARTKSENKSQTSLNGSSGQQYQQQQVNSNGSSSSSSSSTSSTGGGGGGGGGNNENKQSTTAMEAPRRSKANYDSLTRKHSQQRPVAMNTPLKLAKFNHLLLLLLILYYFH